MYKGPKIADPTWRIFWYILDHLGLKKSRVVTQKSGNGSSHRTADSPSLHIVAVVVASYIKSTLCHHAHDFGVAQGHVDTGRTWWWWWNLWGNPWRFSRMSQDDRDCWKLIQMSNANFNGWKWWNMRQLWTNWTSWHLFGNRWNKLEQRQFVTHLLLGSEISMEVQHLDRSTVVAVHFTDGRHSIV